MPQKVMPTTGVARCGMRNCCTGGEPPGKLAGLLRVSLPQIPQKGKESMNLRWMNAQISGSGIP
jgi:hypothetical protein